MISIQERNRQILQMRREGIRRGDVARAFQLSPTRIYLLERRAATDQAMAERRAKLRAEIRTADDPDRMWSVTEKVCGIGKKGFWSIVDGLTGMDMGSRCNHE